MVGLRKDKGMLAQGVSVRSRTAFVEKSERVNAEAAESVTGGAGEYESGSREPSMIIRLATIL